MGSEEKRKRKAEARRKKALEVEERRISPPRPNRIVRSYPSPQALVAIGPVVFAQSTVPPALANALLAAGRPVPPPVAGGMLVDTGATRTCMSEEAARRLGLQPISIAKTYGAGGLHDLNIYQALLTIGITDEKTGLVSQIMVEQPVGGISELGKTYEQAGVKVNGQELRLVGLLGRDFLHYATMTYRGRTGQIEIVVDLEAMRPAPQPVPVV